MANFWALEKLQMSLRDDTCKGGGQGSSPKLYSDLPKAVGLGLLPKWPDSRISRFAT